MFFQVYTGRADMYGFSQYYAIRPGEYLLNMGRRILVIVCFSLTFTSPSENEVSRSFRKLVKMKILIR